MNGIIFDIQNYAIYDGPGIRTTIFLKGCPLKCLWCHNPESQLLKPQISYFQEKCTGCGTCVTVCPNNAIHLLDGKIKRDFDVCTVCGSCVRACPNEVVEIIGKEYSVEHLVEITLRDKPFYDNSGGGVTITGGEPTMQSIFLFELLEKLKKEQVHTAIETCGFFKEELIEKLVNIVDLFLFDIKHMNADLHKEFTNVSNDKILHNFKTILLKVGSERIIPRIPLIPGVNTDISVIKDIVDFLMNVNYSGPIHLMPYNKLAKTKYEKIGKGHLYQDMGDLTEEKLQEIANVFESKSFQVVINH